MQTDEFLDRVSIAFGMNNPAEERDDYRPTKVLAALIDHRFVLLRRSTDSENGPLSGGQFGKSTWPVARSS